MADNFDMKKFLTENQIGPYAKAKLKTEEIGGDIGDAEAEKEMDFLAEYEVIYQWEGSKCYRVDDEGNRDEVNSSYCQRFAESKEEKMEEAVALKLKGYYQILDPGMNDWHDDFQYMGKVAGGSSAGEVGEHMFVAPDAPGSFIFVSIPETDLDTMVKPSMSEGKEKEEEALNEASNPEGDKLVSRFIQGIAKKFDYGVKDAAMFVKETLKRLGY